MFLYVFIRYLGFIILDINQSEKDIHIKFMLVKKGYLNINIMEGSIYTIDEK